MKKELTTKNGIWIPLKTFNYITEKIKYIELKIKELKQDKLIYNKLSTKERLIKEKKNE